jgi:protein transport protein SEC24
LSFLHPRLFGVHDMDQQAGMPSVDDDAPHTAGRDKIVLPDLLNLSIDRLSSEGVFLLDNGVDAFIWVGRASNPATVSALFGVESLDHVDPSQITLSKSGNDLASRLDGIIQALHEESDPTLPSVAPKIQIIREGDMAMEARFFWNFIEDRAQFNGGTYSYADFMEVSQTHSMDAIF